ncbi:hypothetical protein [Candidatus Merdisoma sp. JLR.KK006]|uniref:hypothetical protein n=1 Tax=Candidatus Merdisoma sp. JLR.KK006 TaxID=3112626 RepID=UPI002FF216D6
MLKGRKTYQKTDRISFRAGHSLLEECEALEKLGIERVDGNAKALFSFYNAGAQPIDAG